MQFGVEINNVRPIARLVLRLDLSRNAPLCIVGRNGAGKTTLAKAIMTFALADTFQRTNSAGALREDSAVRYSLDGETFEFTYDGALGSLSTRSPVPQRLRELISVELPIPHGQRFGYFSTLSEANDDIVKAMVLGTDARPDGLIEFLSKIYGEPRFENLREVNFSRGTCTFYRLDDDRYVREDSFSSGEYFLVNLYRRLKSGSRLIFIDEIDISLDAAAQARLVGELRQLCARFEVNVVFTSHSLALMQTLRSAELLYLETAAEQSMLVERSFAYVKSLMFGFHGWDRYILVEDEAAELVNEHLVRKHCQPCFSRFFILVVGGAGQVISLLQRNREHGFLASADAVIAVLDGDQANTGHAAEPDTHCMPIWSVESAFESVYDRPDFQPRLPANVEAALPVVGRHKAIYKAFRRLKLLPDSDLVELACATETEAMRAFAKRVLKPLLCARDEANLEVIEQS